VARSRKSVPRRNRVVMRHGVGVGRDAASRSGGPLQRLQRMKNPRRIRTIDQKGGLTLIAGNSRGTRVIPARGRSSERKRRDLSLIAGCPVDWLTRRTPVRRRTLVSSLRFTIGWRPPASMTPACKSMCTSTVRRLSNEIERELPALTVY